MFGKKWSELSQFLGLGATYLYLEDFLAGERSRRRIRELLKE
jgi:hypothetical protein